MTTRHGAFEAHEDEVREALMAGVSHVDAAREAGISSRTIDRWLERGLSDPAGKYGDFAQAVDGIREERDEVLTDTPMTEDDFVLCLSRAIRRGSVPAMKMWLDHYRPKNPGRGKSVDPMARFDELAERSRLDSQLDAQMDELATGKQPSRLDQLEDELAPRRAAGSLR